MAPYDAPSRGKSVIEATMGLFLMGLGCRMLVTR
jgi:hypothetical protein